MENLVTITVNSTHYYLIDFGRGKLLVDAGWVGLLDRFTGQLKAYHIPLSDIKFILFTHNHPDHAGLVQTIKRLSGARLLILENQIPYIPGLNDNYRSKPEFEPISVEKNDVVNPSKSVLSSIGIQGEIIATPGHSDDSVSLVLDSGLAFTGDLKPPDLEKEENYAATCESWKKLIERKARTIYPSHSPSFDISEIIKQLPASPRAG